jgi:hypothetical protein
MRSRQCGDFEGDGVAAVTVAQFELPAASSEAEKDDERESRAPELALPRHDDAPPWLMPLHLKCDDELALADENLPEGLPRGAEVQHAPREEPELAGAELRLLDVESHHLLFDARGRSIPGGGASDAWSGTGGWRLRHPAEVTHRAGPSPDAERRPTPMFIDAEGEPQKGADAGEADELVQAKCSAHASRHAATVVFPVCQDTVARGNWVC